MLSFQVVDGERYKDSTSMAVSFLGKTETEFWAVEMKKPAEAGLWWSGRKLCDLDDDAGAAVALDGNHLAD